MILAFSALALVTGVFLALIASLREKDPAKLIDKRKTYHKMPRFEDLEAISDSLEIPTWQHVADDLASSGKGLQHTLRDTYWWLETAHALLRHYTLDGDEDVAITRARIRNEFLCIVKLYWVARVEFLVGKAIPVQYFYGRRILKHYFAMTNLVDYLCLITHPELQEKLNGIT